MNNLCLALLFSVLYLLVGGSVPDEKETVDEKDVVVLTQDVFDQFVNDNQFCLVEFYAPWCGHCKMLVPEYAKAATELVDLKIPLGKVDATEEPELSKRFEVRGYPTLKFFKNGVAEEYTGGRSAKDIVSWVVKRSGPAFKEAASLSEAKEAAKDVKVHFVGVFTNKSSPKFVAFETVADTNRDLGHYTVVFDSSTKKEEVRVFRKDEEPVFVEISTEISALEESLKEESFALFGEINGANYQSYNDRPKPLAWFVGNETETAQVAPAMRTVAKDFNISFVSLDSVSFGSHAESVLVVSDFPALVYQRKDGRYVFPSKEFEVTVMRQFFKDVEAGKIEKSLKSEPVPEKDEAPVKTVVALNFEKVVLSKDYATLLEVYAPWCGHCKKLEPVLTEFAESMKGDPSLVVAKFDGTANEVPVEGFTWTGFPTIYYVPAGSSKPVKFEEDRTVEGFKKFVTRMKGTDEAKDAKAEIKEEL